jgi:hypothetical protein
MLSVFVFWNAVVCKYEDFLTLIRSKTHVSNGVIVYRLRLALCKTLREEMHEIDSAHEDPSKLLLMSTTKKR